MNIIFLAFAISSFAAGGNYLRFGSLHAVPPEIVEEGRKYRAERQRIAELSVHEAEEEAARVRAELDEMAERGLVEAELFRAADLRRRLLWLGESKSLDPLLEEIRNRPANSIRFNRAFKDLIEAARPESIERLIDLVFAEEALAFTRLEENDRSSAPGKSFRVAILISQIAAASPSFTEEVRDAMRRPSLDPAPWRDTIREWWVVNKDAFSRADYGSIRWLSKPETAKSPKTDPQASGSNARSAPTPEEEMSVIAAADKHPYVVGGLVAIFIAIAAGYSTRRRRATQR